MLNIFSLATPVNCALATMVAARAAARHHGLNRPVETVLIFGAGLLGLYGCALFKEDGAKVYMSDPVEARREEAVKFGAEKELLPDVKYDVVVEVCGVGSVVKKGLSLLKPGGLIVLVGCVTPNTELGLTGESIVRACATIVGVHNYDQAHLGTAVQFLTETPYREQFREIVSPPMPLSRFEEAFALAKTGRYPRVLLDNTK